MLTFGFASLTDLLSWLAAVSLALKAAATLVLLAADRRRRDRPGWGAALWWTTKVTSGIAVLCILWIARLTGDTSLARLSVLLGAFVAVAIPLKVRRRRHRIAAASLPRGFAAN